jgi:protein SHQ1
LPGNICEDDNSTANYDIATGIFTIKVTKETPGEHFQDLDLLTKLLARRGEQQDPQSAPKKPLIEVISSTSNDEEATQDTIQDGICTLQGGYIRVLLNNNPSPNMTSCRL